jgi:hypothetical protein
MNQLAHIFITYSLLSFIIPHTQQYLIPIAIFSIILDFDHIPGYLRIMFMSKEERSKRGVEQYVDWFRTSLQEPIGVVAIEVCFLMLFLFGVKDIIMGIAAVAIGLHWLIDLLMVHTRPFVPIDNRIISVVFRTKKQRIYSEAIVTAASLIIFLVVYL